MYKFDQERFWAGSAASFWAVIDAQEKALDFIASNDPRARGSDMKAFIDEMAGPVLSVEGNIGVVNIKGSLVNGSSGFMRLYGVLGYDDIRQALADAVADKNVKKIMLRVDSGGGAVAGVQELGDFIRSVSAVKPVTTHSDNMMASAAYWLGVSGNYLSASSTAIVGSIGVLIVHQEVSKMMQDAGVQTTVIRSGKYKALANRYEPLSDLAKAELQSQVDDLEAAFIGYVADRRGTTVDAARRKMGQGREFLGAKAQDAGLVDGIMSFSDAFAKTEASSDSNRQNARKAVASSRTQANNAPNEPGATSMKVNLTPEQLAALAAGATIESLGLSAEDTAELKAEQEAANAEAAAAAAAAAAAEAAKTGQQASQQTGGNDNVVAFLKAELKDANTTLATVQAELKEANTKMTTMQAEHNALLKIARGSLGNMQVALGGRNTAEAVDSAQVLAEHQRLSELFAAKFPVGRVSATPGKKDEQATEAKTDPLLHAALAAAKNQY